MENPAIQAFIAEVADRLSLGQVLLRPLSGGFELRHEDDRDIPDGELTAVSPGDLRELASHDDRGRFRPLKSASTLQRGWRCRARNADELEAALDNLYPGAVADWFAARNEPPPITHYRDFTNRQTGMYRASQLLSDEQAALAIRAQCDSGSCLKTRLWTVGGLDPGNSEAGASHLVCLEPCALMLEFARKAARMLQVEPVALELAPDDIATLKHALQTALEQPLPADSRVADFSAPDNPTRMQLTLNKLNALGKPLDSPDKE